ncbi:MAG: hypothetical protein GF411_09070 [Candidatus Lokiarchaeota archaeon]|nr:hypothetical protein [Candidatus Lokiarchaeota archaeon]
MQKERRKNRLGLRARRYLTLLPIILLLTVPIFSTTITSEQYSIDIVTESKGTHAASGPPTYTNLSEYCENIWNTTSEDRISNYTKTLSEDYPERRWDSTSSTPTTPLSNAIIWVNTTIQAITDGNLAFNREVDERFIYAKQDGIGADNEPAIVISGILDSEDYPGANSVGISVAMVLEMIDILSEYSLSFDIYYVLSLAGRYNSHIDYGSRDFVGWVLENDIGIYTTLSFDKMLFTRTGFINHNKIAIRTISSALYHDRLLIPDLLLQTSKQFGSDMFLLQTDNEKADRSTASEMWRVGLAGIHLAQGYYPDPNSDSETDVWNNDDYNYDKAVEAISTSASVVIHLGLMDGNHAATYYDKQTIEISSGIGFYFTVSGKEFINVSISWQQGTELRGRIENLGSSTTVYERIENDSLIVMKYKATSLGSYRILLNNLGSVTAEVSLNITCLEDFDGDSLHGGEETEIGTSVYQRDTDSDNVNDNVEVQMGTSPLLQDSDQDGATDNQEIEYGSNPLLNDSDGDQLSDGFEIARNMDPTDIDTDDDELGDYDEIYLYFTDPTSEDSDFDGLEDGFEINAGLDPLSPDSDQDSLGDLFEILNQLNATNKDTDGDGWSDAYEVEFCLSPTNPDTDGDGIPDGLDWDPRDHWINVIAPIALFAILILTGIFGFLKLRLYKRLDAEEAREATA